MTIDILIKLTTSQYRGALCLNNEGQQAYDLSRSNCLIESFRMINDRASDILKLLHETFLMLLFARFSSNLHFKTILVLREASVVMQWGKTKSNVVLESSNFIL